MIAVVILLVVGVAGCVLGFVAKHHKDAMARTPTIGCADVGNVADWDDPVPCEVVGTAEPAKGPLTGPFSGTPCMWYRSKVSRRYRDRERDSKGNYRTVTRTETVSEQESSAPFGVRDLTGTVWVFPDGANVIGESRTVDRFEPYMPHRETAPTSGSLAERALSIGMNLLAQRSESTLGYEYEEWVIRDGAKLYVRAGAIRDHTGSAWLQRPANGPFLISTRSEEDLTRKASIGIFAGFGVGAAALACGAVLAVVQALA